MARSLSPTQSRLLDMNTEIMGNPTGAEIRFLHTVLAQCGLPYRDLKGQRDYTVRNGRSSLVLSAGHLMDPVSREAVLQGLPYGSKPRLLMLHLCSEAVRNQSPVVGVGDSMSAFMKDLGMSVTGGKTGTVGRFKEQMNRLAASRMQLFMDLGDHVVTLNPAPMVERFDVWFPTDEKQKTLWPSEVQLSQQFYESLVEHALPIDMRAIRGLQNNARALDTYTWLSHRLSRVKSAKGDRVSWSALHGQFGAGAAEGRTFKRAMTHALKLALAAYPGARVEQIEGGVQLYPSSPPVARKPSKRAVGR